MIRQGKLFDETGRLLERKTLHDIDEWLKSAPPEWRDRLRYFIACGVPRDRAFVPAWWSLSKDSRREGQLPTLSALADWLGVSRETLNKWESQTYGEPPMTLRDMGREARILRMTEFGPDVDQALISQLEGGEASAAHFKLYYEIVGMVRDESTVNVNVINAAAAIAALRQANEELSGDDQ